jgi:hypothetical protein
MAVAGKKGAKINIMVKQKCLLFAAIIQLLVLVGACYQPAPTIMNSPADLIEKPAF